MKRILLLLILFSFYPLAAQESEAYEIKEVNCESLTYHEYRIQNSVPPYNLSKIKNQISILEKIPINKEINDNEESIAYYLSLPEKDFSKLSVKEKFTYVMIHPEYRFQDSGDQVILGEVNKIFGNLPSTVEGVWSDRQREFLKSNQNVVITLVKETALKDVHIGLNYKIALKEICAIEIIPFLIDFYITKDKKDKDILTLLMLLVKKSNYHPFIRSNIFRELYSESSPYESYIDYNTVNEEYILKTAANLYSQSPKSK